MAVYTHITQEALRDFLSSYAIGELKHFEGIKEGTENTNYRLITNQGRFILTLFEKRTHQEDLPYFIALMRHAGSKNILCPYPMADRSGEVLKSMQERPTAIFSELEGSIENEPTKTQCHEVGMLLARFHQATADFSGHRSNGLWLGNLLRLVDEIDAKADKIETGLAQELRGEIDFLEHHWPRHLPQGTIHADLFPDNILWKGNALTGMLDFYFSCSDILAYDLAICINGWCFSNDRHFQTAYARAMIDGYESIRALNHAEHDKLGVLCRGAALRFLVTRLHDLFFAPASALTKKRDPVEYLRKNRYFQAHDIF
jgi:homoserine kinase type II